MKASIGAKVVGLGTSESSAWLSFLNSVSNLFFDEVNHDSQNILYAQTIYFKILN